MVYGWDFFHPNTVVRGANKFSEEYKMVNMKEASQAREVRGGNQARWKLPPEGKYKVNWDAEVDTVNGRRAHCEGLQLEV